MAGRVTRARRWFDQPRVVIPILIAATAFFGFLAYDGYDDAVRLRRSGVEAPATVVGVHPDGGRTDPPYVTVSFTTLDGRAVTTRVDDWYWRPEPQIGDEGRVRYDPADPGEYVQDARLRPDFVGPSIAAVAALAFAAAALAWWAGRLPGWLLTPPRRRSR